MAGTKIWNATLLGSISGTEKIPVGNGGETSVAVSVDQLKEYAIEEVSQDVDEAKTAAATAAAAAAKNATDITSVKASVDELMFSATGYDVDAYDDDSLAAATTEVYGSADIASDWTPYLLDTTDNADETTTPVGTLNKANYLRYEDGAFAPTVGITEEMRAACDVALYDEDGNLVYEAGAYDAEAEWETDKALIVAGGYVESAARKLYTDSGATTEVAHKLRPWETVETKYTVGIGLPYEVYLLDNVIGNSGKRWKGVFKKATVRDGIDVTPYKLAPTALAPCPSTTVGGKTRNFFYAYDAGDTNCKSAAGQSGLCTMFSNGRTYPRTNDAQQVNNMTWARANNADTTLSYPFAEGGYHALNTLITSLEVKYATKYLHSSSMFSSGISSNDSCSSESTWKSNGGVRYKLSDSDTWLYAQWSNSSHGIYYNASGSRINFSTMLNQEYPKEQCMESQMALSYAVETGIAEDTEFEFYGGTYWYENVTGALGAADGQMNARVYKKMSQTFDAYNSAGDSVSWDVEVVLRTGLAEGMNLSGDIFAYWGGGCEMVMTCDYLQDVQTYGNRVKAYLQPDQTEWLRETTFTKADLGVFDFESKYLLVGEGLNLADGYAKRRNPYSPLKTENGGNISTGECFYGYTRNTAINTLNTRGRLAVRVRGNAYYTYCSGRYVNCSNLASHTYRNHGCSAQSLLNMQ